MYRNKTNWFILFFFGFAMFLLFLFKNNKNDKEMVKNNMTNYIVIFIKSQRQRLNFD